jgi:hypothetical protein
MPRTRYIRPEFFDDTTLSDLPIPARYLYSGLWTWADCAGVFEFDVKLIKAHVFPHDELAHGTVGEWLQGLVRKGRVLVAEHDGKLFGLIPKFTRHQYCHKGEKRKYEIPLEKFNGPAKDPNQFELSTMQASGQHDASPKNFPLNLNLNPNSNLNMNGAPDSAAPRREHTIEPDGSEIGNACVTEWLATLKHFKTPRNLIANEDISIGRKIQADCAENVRLALIGARYEPARDNFDPGKCLSLDRVLGPKQYAKNVNRGIQAEQKRKEREAVRLPTPDPEPEQGPRQPAPEKVRKMLRAAGYLSPADKTVRSSNPNPDQPAECLSSQEIEAEKKRQTEALNDELRSGEKKK